jgi:cystathionine gamma-synthase
MVKNMRTAAIHAGRPKACRGDPVAADLTLGSSFHTTPDLPAAGGLATGEPEPFYGRWGNPTVRLLERRIAALEGAEDGLCFASGMGAVSALFLSQLRSGDHLVISDVCYAGVAELAHDILGDCGIVVQPVNTADIDAIRAAIRPTTKLVYIETPANPVLRLTDIAAVARLCQDARIALAVDSTLATPIATRPISLGADFVVHSLTKYACGHGDTLGGALVGRAAQLGTIRERGLIHVGAALHPFAAWLIERSLHSLPQRMAAHAAGAEAVATRLAAHPRVKRVLYPGLASHPQHALARRQMANFSGMIALSIEGERAMARRLAERLEIVAYAVSLGKSHSNIFYYPTDEIAERSFRLSAGGLAAYRELAGDGIFRLSVGLEDPEDIVEDLVQAIG